MKIQGTLNLF